MKKRLKIVVWFVLSVIAVSILNAQTTEKRVALVIGLFLMLLATTIGVTPPLLTRTLIDDVLNVQPNVGRGVEPVSGTSLIGRIERFAPRGSRTLLFVLVGLLFLITVSTNGIRAIRGYMMTWFGEKVTMDLRIQVYRHLHALSLSFFNQRETGRIMSRLTNDASRLQDFISEGMQEMIRRIFTIFVICMILFTLNWQLSAFVLIPRPFLVPIRILSILGSGILILIL